VLKKLFLILFLYFPFAGSAFCQIDINFIKHLSGLNLKREHLSYLKSMQAETPSDSICYLQAKFHLQYRNYDSFLNSFSQSSQLFKLDSNALARAGNMFLTGPSILRQKFFDASAGFDESSLFNSIRNVHLAGINPFLAEERLIPESLQEDFLNYRRIYNRKPLIAGALSLAVPGLGKWYAGRRNSFFVSLFSQAIYGYTAYESVRRLGPSHPFSIFALSFFGVFYSSNVVGSYFSVNQVKKERATQFSINAENHYNLYLPDRHY
jgi:hypothetical protein